MDYVVEFDFSKLDLLPSFFGVSSDEALRILELVTSWFYQSFEMFFFLIGSTGFLWILSAGLFFVSLSRLVIAPIVGGRSLDLGPDRVRSRQSKKEEKE